MSEIITRTLSDGGIDTDSRMVGMLDINMGHIDFVIFIVFVLFTYLIPV